MGKGAKTKGYLKNLSTGVIKKFMYNPSDIQSDINNDYQILLSPGLSKPKIHYASGNERAHSFDLFLYGKDTQEYISFLEEFMTPTTLYGKPPLALWVTGSTVKKVCMTKLKIKKEMFDENLNVTGATCSIELLEVTNNDF